MLARGDRLGVNYLDRHRPSELYELRASLT